MSEDRDDIEVQVDPEAVVTDPVTSETSGGAEPADTPPLSEEEVRRALEWLFDMAADLRDRPYWRAEPWELQKVVPAILPHLRANPRLAAAIRALDLTGGWGELFLMVYRRVLRDVREGRAARLEGRVSGRGAGPVGGSGDSGDVAELDILARG